MARKYRPSLECLYVFGEIHGNAQSLEVIFDRILPLRKFKVSPDRMVLLGDYIDGFQDGHRVLDLLINAKEAHGDRVVVLRGNHEDMMLRAYYGLEGAFDTWMDNGGRTTINGYLNRMGSKANPYSIMQNRLRDIIPKEHIDFITTMSFYHIDNVHCFMHGGINPKLSVIENNNNTFMYGESATYVKRLEQSGEIAFFADELLYVCAHNPNAKNPSFFANLICLNDNSKGNRIIVMEMNSGKISAVNAGKGRLYPIA